MDSLPAHPRAAAECGPSVFQPSRWITADEYDRLRAHPAFPAAAAAFATSVIRLYSGNLWLNKVLCDRGRALIGLFVLHLDAAAHGDPRAPGATLAGVQALCAESGLCSRGRAASMLAAMRLAGFIAPAADPADRRRRRLVPRPKLLDYHRRLWREQFEAMAPIYAGAAPTAAALDRPDFAAAFVAALGRTFFAGFRVLDHVPVLRDLTESNAGLLALTSFAMPLDAERSATAPLSISALSRRFSVSRGHVRNLIARAMAAGLVAHETGAEEILALPPLTEALFQFYGVLFILFDRCAAAARATEAADPAN